MPIDSGRLIPTVDFWAWRTMGACQSQPVELFFHSEDTPRGQRRRNERDAARICEECPVLATCRAHALRTGERYGVWGGLTENQRLRILSHAPGQAGRDRIAEELAHAAEPERELVTAGARRR
ncbi:WhiB family transcriptional regulator [Dietzia sp.]|uniref:WhiB family transcriptional regulator n=1 Tax=Dietzia sp. TaxID=1871616 RepID=UPI002FD9B07D